MVELNYIELFRRQACRLTGTAIHHARGHADYEALRRHFTSWDYLDERMRGIFVVEVGRARHILSPAYDIGAEEEALKAEWLGKYTALLG